MSLWGNITSGIRKVGKTAGTILGGASGVDTANAAQEAGEFARRSEKTGGEQLARGAAQQDIAAQGYGDIAASAKQAGVNYDQQVAAALRQSPEQVLAAQNAAAEAQAAKEAQTTTQQATKSALKAGRTGGMLGGQAALAAAQGAGSTYAGAKQSAADAARANYAAARTQQLQGLQQQAGEMAGRQATAAGGQAGLAGQSLGTATSYQGAAGSALGTKTSGSAAAGQQSGGIIGQVAGMGGQIAGLFSDQRLKDEIAPISLSDALNRVRSLSYKYKGADRPEAGVVAQDLEGGAMDPAVVDTPEGKMIDTRRLTTMNTAGLSEHEKRLRDVESIISALAAMKEPVNV